MNLAQILPNWIQLSIHKRGDLLTEFSKVYPKDLDISCFLKSAEENGVPLTKIDFGDWSRIDMYVNKEKNICFVFEKYDGGDMTLKYRLVDVSAYPIINENREPIGQLASDHIPFPEPSK